MFKEITQKRSLQRQKIHKMGVKDYKLQKKKTSKLKDIVTETILNETQKEKRPKNNEQSISELWDLQIV